jgi:hypothetical protein
MIVRPGEPTGTRFFSGGQTTSGSVAETKLHGARQGKDSFLALYHNKDTAAETLGKFSAYKTSQQQMSRQRNTFTGSDAVQQSVNHQTAC